MKINKAYNNEALLEALKDRDTVLESIFGEVNMFNISDENLRCLNNFTKLNQFQKDLLYLTSIKGVYEIADLYAVSPSYLYKNIKEIKTILQG